MQADDLRALADHLRGMTPKVWIVAYDTGATSALNAAARGKADTIAGLALISPILEEPEPTSSAAYRRRQACAGKYARSPDQPRVDSCSRPAVDRIENAAAALKAPNFQSITIRGGSEQYSVSDPFEYPENSCNMQAHHALAGREAAVSRIVIDWIDQQNAAAK